MKTARDFIRKHEGLRLKAYPDPASGGAPWTIGYGHTKNVRRGDTCTLEQAEAWLDADLADAYAVVDRAVKVALTEPQRDALASFVFNIGPGYKGVKDGLVSLKNGQPSTLLRRLNAGDYVAAASQFPLWTKAGRSGKVMPGLVKRRGEERALFLAGTLRTDEPFPQETEMLPLAGTILVNALPALFGALPEIAAIFRKPDVAERNVEAVAKVGEILIQSTGAANMQQAVERVQADPDVAASVNEALRMNRAELSDLLERAWDRDEVSLAAARQFSREDKPLFGNWQFVHILSLLLVLMGGGAAIGVLFISDDPSERVMALQTLLIVGFASAIAFWLGSSRSSQVKDLVRDQ